MFYLIVTNERKLIAIENIKPVKDAYPFNFEIIEVERIDSYPIKFHNEEPIKIPVLSDLEKLKNFLLNIDVDINKKVIDAGILSNQLFYASKVADNALLILQWYSDNKPDIDPSLMDAWEIYIDGDNDAIDLSDPFIAKYITAIAEAAAYRKTTKPEMTPVDMIRTWEKMWIYQMRAGFALIGYQRRLEIEQAKMNF